MFSHSSVGSGSHAGNRGRDEVEKRPEQPNQLRANWAGHSQAGRLMRFLFSHWYFVSELVCSPEHISSSPRRCCISVEIKQIIVGQSGHFPPQKFAVDRERVTIRHKRIGTWGRLDSNTHASRRSDSRSPHPPGQSQKSSGGESGRPQTSERPMINRVSLDLLSRTLHSDLAGRAYCTGQRPSATTTPSIHIETPPILCSPQPCLLNLLSPTITHPPTPSHPSFPLKWPRDSLSARMCICVRNHGNNMLSSCCGKSLAWSSPSCNARASKSAV